MGNTSLIQTALIAGLIAAFGKLDGGYTPRGWRRALPEDWLAR